MGRKERRISKYVELDKIMQFPIRRDHYDRENGNEHFINGIESVMEYIETLPTIDAVPVRHGKWIYSNDFHWYVASCNKCGYQRRTDIKAEGWNQWNYCPNCGARMDAEREEERHRENDNDEID